MSPKDAVSAIIAVGVVAGGIFVFDLGQRVLTPNQYAAARQAERTSAQAKQAELDRVASADREKQQTADKELSEASYALYHIRATAPTSEHQAEQLRIQEATALARWEAAQLAANGVDWREKQAALESDARETFDRRSAR